MTSSIQFIKYKPRVEVKFLFQSGMVVLPQIRNKLCLIPSNSQDWVNKSKYIAAIHKLWWQHQIGNPDKFYKYSKLLSQKSDKIIAE